MTMCDPSGYTNQILQGDALSTLRTLPDEVVQCVVTSPPYWMQRSYLSETSPHKHLELGLEESPYDYIESLVEIFHEVKRVLRPDGTLF